MLASRQLTKQRARLERCIAAQWKTCSVAKVSGAIIQEAMLDNILHILHLTKQGIILLLLLQDLLLLHIIMRLGGSIQSIPITMADI